MIFKSVASINGVVSVAYGLVGLVAPAALGSMYGVEITGRELLLLRLLSASYLGLGVLCWVARGLSDGAARRSIATGVLAAWGLSLPVAFAGQLAGLANTLGWSAVGLQLAFVLGWAWALREAARSTSRLPA